MHAPRTFGCAALMLATAVAPVPRALAQSTPEQRIGQLESEIAALKDQIRKIEEDRAGAGTVLAPGPRFASDDGAFTFRLRGRVEMDAAGFNVREGSRDLNSGTELRRARLGMEGSMYEDWFYRLEADFAGASRDDRDGQEVDVKDAFVRYQPGSAYVVTAGQHKTPNSLERLASSASLTFLERASVVEAFTDRANAGGDYKVGLSTDVYGEAWTLAAGVFGENVAITGAGGADEGFGLHARATAVPASWDDGFLHLGVSAYWRSAGGAGNVRFGDRPEVRVDGTRLVDTGNIAADSYGFSGLEAVASWGPASLQSEYARVWVDSGAGGRDPSFDGAYVTLAYFLTGETLPYRRGLIEAVKPLAPFDPAAGQWGAFQVAARYSTIDLDDDGIAGGEADNWTLGLNWYLNANLRAMLNYVRFDTTRAGAPLDGDALALRVGFIW